MRSIPKHGSLRRQVRIACPPERVWELAGDPARIHEWFPGVESCTYDGTTRIVKAYSGVEIAEEIITLDPLQRRMQYRINAPLFREHRSTLDVIGLGDGTSLVVYSVDAEPATLALVIAGVAGEGLERIRAIMEGDG